MFTLVKKHGLKNIQKKLICTSQYVRIKPKFEDITFLTNLNE